jgi:hypothetical protein
MRREYLWYNGSSGDFGTRGNYEVFWEENTYDIMGALGILEQEETIGFLRRECLWYNGSSGDFGTRGNYEV